MTATTRSNRLSPCVGVGLCLLALLQVASAAAQQSERFGPYELHYSVVNTTFIQPEVAATYGITRGKKRAILNLAVRKHVDDSAAEPLSDGVQGGPHPAEPRPAEPRPAGPMELQGKTWDLMQNQPLTFQEVREGPAVYYIAEFKFINEEWRFFEVEFRPEGADRSYTFKFKHQVFIN